MPCQPADCTPCEPNALATQLLALDLQAIDVEAERLATLVEKQNEEIESRNTEICKLKACLAEYKGQHQILTERSKATLGKLRGIKAVCR